MSGAKLFDPTLKGKLALVCGASQGIGEASARVLAELGAEVIVLARNESKLESVVSRLAGQGHSLIACDVNDHANLKARVENEVSKRKKPIEILVNNSAGPKGGPVVDAKPEEFSAAFSQHLITNQVLAQLLTPGMKERKHGRIINIISTSVRVPIPGLGVSNTVRAAVASWAKTLSLELGPFGITVNNVLPGYTKTERLSSLLSASAQRLGKTEEQVAEEWRASTPARRFAEPEEVAAAVAFLAGPLAGFISGVSLPVDGGRIGAL
jgi:3-oxoacyl-[acyl-carrier protein] reductase